ncbi:MAG: DUF6049 family protein [Propionibacteriaceae bacterium]|nr:DUF6049 family protein [Propionibacteriaceae bacterium]
MSRLGRDAWPGGPARPATGAVGTRFVLVLLAFVLIVAGSIGSPREASAALDPDPVTLQLDVVDPALPARSDTVTLRGTVRNVSAEPIDEAQVVLWRRRTPLTTPAELRDLAGSATNEVTGQQMWLEGAYAELPAEQPWAPGETRPFEITTPVEAFGFPATPGAYLIGAQVVGRHGGRTLSTLGQGRALLPLGAQEPAGTPGTNAIVSAVLLSSTPSMVRPGLFTDDHLAQEVGPDGRLTALLAAAEREHMSWLIDPSLLDELTAMAAGYRVRVGDAEEPGGGAEAAGQWLAAYARLDRARGYQVPYAIPDLTMLQRADLGDVTRRAQAAARGVEGTVGLPLVAYAARGALSNEAIGLADGLEPVAILAATTDANGGLVAPIGHTPIINFAPTETPGLLESPVQARQRMLAESLLTAQTESGSTTVRLLTTSAAAAADDMAQAPWLSRSSLPDLLTREPLSWSAQLPYDETERAAELSETNVLRLREVVQDYGAVSDMVVDEVYAAWLDASTARTASSWWRGDPEGFTRFAEPHVAAANELWQGQAVELTAQRSVIMSGQSGSFPMTVTNKLDHPVRVILTFESFQPQRLSIPAMSDVIVPARQGVTVNVQPAAVGNGPVRVSAQVTAPGGRPVSKRVWLTVEATNFGRVGWIIVVASGVVLIATTALRIRQVRRERMAARRAAPDVHQTPPVVKIDRPPLDTSKAGSSIDRDNAPDGGEPR